jgi:predicted SAM-dependent methyltransferase
MIDPVKRVLNVGGNCKAIPLPEHFSGWEHILLDIDRKDDVDIVCDARRLVDLEGNKFDAVYCSHNLEHYYLYDAHKVLAGFHHVLKPNGFAHIRVPDVVSNTPIV